MSYDYILIDGEWVKRLIIKEPAIILASDDEVEEPDEET